MPGDDAPHDATSSCIVLTDALISRTPREIAGPRTGNRYEFQKSWSIKLLLELHEAKTDYVMLFDYHDDVAVLDSSESPTTLHLYQVKTRKKGLWTRPRLVHRDTTTKRSVLGKLAMGYTKFPEFVSSLTLVTNAAFEIALRDGRRSTDLAELALPDVTDAELKKIRTALKKELQASLEPACEAMIRMQVTFLSVGDHDSHCRGLISKFLDAYGEDGQASASALHRTLTDTVRRKTHAETLPSSYKALLAERGLSRDDMDQLLARLSSRRTFGAFLEDALASLAREGTPFLKLQELRAISTTYTFERVGAAARVFANLESTLGRHTRLMRESGGLPQTLTDYLVAMRRDVWTTLATQTPFATAKMDAISLRVLYEELSSTAATSEEAEP